MKLVKTTSLCAVICSLIPFIKFFWLGKIMGTFWSFLMYFSRIDKDALLHLRRTSTRWIFSRKANFFCLNSKKKWLDLVESLWDKRKTRFARKISPSRNMPLHTLFTQETPLSILKKKLPFYRIKLPCSVIMIWWNHNSFHWTKFSTLSVTINL